MKKILVIIGSVIALIGIFLPFADMTLGWWQYTQRLNTILGDTVTKYYLSPFGIISNDANSDTTQIEGYVLLIASIVTILGGVVAAVGAFTDKSLVAIIGSVLMIAGLAYFCYSLGNIEEIRQMLYDDTISAIFGKNEDIWILIGTADLQWRLGNGFFITAAGSLLTLVASFLKEK